MKRISKRKPLSRNKKKNPPTEMPVEILRQFLSRSNVIFWAVDLKGKICISEGAGLKVLGLKPADLAGKNIFKRFPRNSDFQKAFRRALKGEAFSLILTLENSFFETRFIPWKNTERRILGSFGFSIDVTESFKSIQELWRKEKREEVLTQTSLDLVTFFSRKGQRIYESPGVEKILGFKPGERESFGLFGLIHPQDRKGVKASYNRALQNPDMPIRVEARLRHKDGHWIHGDVIMTNFLHVPGVEALVVQTRDVTDKKTAEEALRLSELRFRGLIENSQDIITLLDRDGHRIYEAPSIQRILGFRPGERKGTTYDNHPPQDVPKARAAVRVALKNPGKIVPAELKVRRKDGTFIDAEMTITNLLKDPAVRGIVVNARDVTQRKKAEEELRSRERWFRAMIEKSYDVIGLLGADGSVRYISPGVVNLTGYTMEERGDRISFDALHPDEREKARLMYRRLVQTPGAFMNERLRFMHRDGHYRVVDVTATNLLEDPDVEGIVVNYRDVTGMVAAEEALRQKESHYRALIEHSHDLVYILDREAKRVYESPSVERILGYKPGERSGSTIFDFLHPDDRDRVRGPVKDILEKPGASLVFTARIRHKDGRWVEMEIAGENLLENPTVKGVVINARDITDRKKAEIELRQSEEKFRSLIENSNDVVALVDTQGRSIYISPSYEKIVGYRIPDRLGRSFFEIIHPEDAPGIRRSYESLIQNPGATFNGRFRLKNADGKWGHYEASATNHMENPLVRAIILNFRDVTQGVMAEEALVKSEEYFRNLIENSYDLFMILDQEGKVSYISPSVKRVTGFDASERMGRNSMERLHPEDKERINQEFKEFIKNKIPSMSTRYRIQHKNGSWIYMEGTANNLLDNPSIRGIVLNTRDVTERILVEEKFRGLIENAHDVISILSPEGITRYVSSSMEKIMGYTPQEREGKPFLEIVHPEDRAELVQKLEELNRRKDGTVLATVRVLHKNGSWRILEGAGTNLTDNPAIQGIVLNYRDVTERVKAEEAQIQSQESFRALIEKSPDGILVHREDIISYANPAFLRMAGYEKAEEVIGRPWNFHLPPGEYQEVWDRIQTLASEPGAYNPPRERTLKRKDGTLLPIESLSFNIMVENEKLAVGVIRDLSEKKQAALALMRSEESFRNFIENSPDAIMIHSKDHALYVNPAFLKMLGYDQAGELVGKPWGLVVPAEEKDHVAGRINRLREISPVNPSIERRIIKKNGQSIPVEVVSFTILFEGQMAWAAVFRDLTERKNAEQVLLKYTRLGAMGEMAAGLAHEIRNPLSGIGLSAQYLKRKWVEAPDAEVQVQNILDQTERLKQLVNDTLDFSRDSTAQDLNRVDAMELMQTSLRFVQVQFGPRHAGFHVKWTFEKGRFFLTVNTNRIQQVLVNLMLNAFQAMEKGGTLTLGCTQEGPKMILRVADDGSGISPEVRTRLFEPFFTTKQNGSGLGLSVSQKIVEAHGGVLRVDSLPQGTAFLVELPASQAQNTDTKP